MDIETVKEYLRIDDDADDVIIQIMMDAAEQYITDAVGGYDENNPKTTMLFLMLMQDFYENRILTVKEAEKQRLSYVVTTMVAQLQVEELLKEGATGG